MAVCTLLAESSTQKGISQRTHNRENEKEREREREREKEREIEREKRPTLFVQLATALS
jgi:hypothetical protein